MFPNPFIISISYFTDDSNPTTLPVSTFKTSPGASFLTIGSPSISKNNFPVPFACCNINPSPPKNPAENFLVNETFTSTLGSAQRKAPFWKINLQEQ